MRGASSEDRPSVLELGLRTAVSNAKGEMPGAELTVVSLAAAVLSLLASGMPAARAAHAVRIRCKPHG